MANATSNATSNATFTAVISGDFKRVTAPLADATFVAFRDPDGVYSDGVVWEREGDHWSCVAWDGESYGPSDVDDMELELVTAVADGVGEFYFGSNCSRAEFFEYVFGHEAESDGAFGPDYDYPPHMAEPVSMFAKDNWHYYAFTLDPKQVEEQERELHDALDRLDEAVHMEMYGHSYRV